MGSLKNDLMKFCKAQCSAWVASAVDFGLTILLADICGLWYAYATFIGAVSGGITNCSINYRWVFHAFGMKKKHVAMRYAMVWCGSIILNTGGTCLLTELSKQNYLISKVLVAVLVAVFWNYELQNHFVFHARKKKQTY